MGMRQEEKNIKDLYAVGHKPRIERAALLRDYRRHANNVKNFPPARPFAWKPRSRQTEKAPA